MCIRIFLEQNGGAIVEMNVRSDHVHLIVMVPPKVSISDYTGIVKGRTAIRGKREKAASFQKLSSKRKRAGLKPAPARKYFFGKALFAVDQDLDGREV